MVEKKIKKIVETQEFYPNDQLGHMVEEYAEDGIYEDSLKFVCAAGDINASYDAFMKNVEAKKQ